MTGHEYSDVIEQLGMRKIEAATFLHVNETTARRWIKGTNAIPIPIVMLLRVMVRYNLTPDSVLALLERKGDLGHY